MKKLLIYMTLMLSVCSCGLDEPALSDVGSGLIEFSSSKMRIITKSGDYAQKFDEGTAFRLFAVASPNGGEQDWSNTVLYGTEGKESSGYIDYGQKSSYGLPPCNVLDFYGVTYGNSESVGVEGEAGSVPKVKLTPDGSGVFPDLMYSDNLKNKNSSSGLLNMEFRHTLSKLKFEILKQDESADSDKKLENATLKKVVLKGTGVSGTFNIGTGQWESVVSGDRTVYEGSYVISSTGQTFAECLAIPVTDGDVTLEIYLEGIEGGQEYVEYTLKISEEQNLRLLQNYEYTLSIAVLKNDVRVVTVTPRVYDWIDVEVGSDDTYFGQPSYFGGLMWMDRNLGAKSADCENDWYNSIGYYYQHGRNIPYILDVDVWQTHFKNVTGGNYVYIDYRSNPVKFQFPYGLIYTYDENLNKIIDVLDLQYEFKEYDQIAINPGDAGKDYRFILGLSPKLAVASHSWAVEKSDTPTDRYYYADNNTSNQKFYYKEVSENATYWSGDVERQPCPKGWRLPTREDLYGFMPEYTGNMEWQSSYTIGTPLKATTSTSSNFYYSGANGNPFDKSYSWKYFAGKFDVDKTMDATMYYSNPVPADLGRVYGIKYEGTDKAYRVMFEQIKAKVEDDDSERLYVRVSRFNSSEDDVFKENGSQWNLHKFDWDNPVEYMDFPLCGFFDSYGYIDDFGDGCIMRTADADGEGRNWTIYFRNTYRGVSVGGTSCRTLGDQIRCVRDVNAEW